MDTHTQKALDFRLNLGAIARKDTFQKRKVCYITKEKKIMLHNERAMIPTPPKCS